MDSWKNCPICNVETELGCGGGREMKDVDSFDCEFAELSYNEWQPYVSCRKRYDAGSDECPYDHAYLCDVREPRKKAGEG